MELEREDLASQHNKLDLWYYENNHLIDYYMSWSIHGCEHLSLRLTPPAVKQFSIGGLAVSPPCISRARLNLDRALILSTAEAA
jgi:hypothetical protein